MEKQKILEKLKKMQKLLNNIPDHQITASFIINDETNHPNKGHEENIVISVHGKHSQTNYIAIDQITWVDLSESIYQIMFKNGALNYYVSTGNIDIFIH